MEKYLGSTKRAGQGTAPVRTHRFEDVLERTRFGAPRSIFVPGMPDLVRDTESVLSGYFSMSFSAPHLFGDRVNDFARDVRKLLTSRSPEGLFWDWPGDTEVSSPSSPDEDWRVLLEGPARRRLRPAGERTRRPNVARYGSTPANRPVTPSSVQSPPYPSPCQALSFQPPSGRLQLNAGWNVTPAVPFARIETPELAVRDNAHCGSRVGQGCRGRHGRRRRAGRVGELPLIERLCCRSSGGLEPCSWTSASR